MVQNVKTKEEKQVDTCFFSRQTNIAFMHGNKANDYNRMSFS